MYSKELKEQLVKDFHRNLRQSENNEYGHTVEILGIHGIGKTDIASEAGEEAFGECDTIFISAAQLEDISDLVGLPSKMYVMTKGDIRVEIPSELISLYLDKGYEYKEMHVVTVLPEWAKRAKSGKSVILFDDYRRANPIIIQALMNFLLSKKLGTWSLPTGVPLILTSNPDDSEESYAVTATDPAQVDRMVTYKYEFSHANWVQWARDNNYPDVAVSFMAENPRFFEPGVNRISPRRWTLFMKVLDDHNIADIPFIRNHLMAINADLAHLFIAYITDEKNQVITPEAFKDKGMVEIRSIFKRYENNVEKQAAFTTNVVLHLVEHPEDTKLFCDRIFKTNIINAELKYDLFLSLQERIGTKIDLRDYTEYFTNDKNEDIQ